jgi:hypothetical protein
MLCQYNFIILQMSGKKSYKSTMTIKRKKY